MKKALLTIAVAIAAVLLFAEAQAKPISNERSTVRKQIRAVQYPRVGQQVRSIPNGHRNIRVNRQNYGYYNGAFYRPGGRGVFVVVSAPLGARVGALPPGAISFGIGPRNYFYGNLTYFLWDKPTREYIVVEEPAGSQAALVSASVSVSGDIFVYPNEGQSNEQRDSDRYDCYLWAVDQTGFDPGAGDPNYESAADYRRAISACLEGRGYTVK